MNDFVETLFIGWGVWYTGYNYRVNCKSEGNIFLAKNEEKGDDHFCKTDYDKERSLSCGKQGL